MASAHGSLLRVRIGCGNAVVHGFTIDVLAQTAHFPVDTAVTATRSILHGDALPRRVPGEIPGAMSGKRAVCLGIPDESESMDPDLIERLRDSLSPYVEVPG